MGKYILFVGGFILLSFIYQGVCMYIHSMSKKKFESENPDASIMVLKDRPFHPFGFTTTLNCLTINGEPKEQIMTGYAQRGYYLKPGKNILEMQFESQRPGIIHKWVRTTYDPQKIEVEVEANKKYTITYDKKEDKYLFEEVA